MFAQRSRPNWEQLHALPLPVHHDRVTRWIDDVSTEDVSTKGGPRSVKRPQILRDLPSTSKRQNTTIYYTEQTPSPIRRSRRNQRTERSYENTQNVLSRASFSVPAPSFRSLSPPKKKAATTKADLAYLNPNINFHPLRNRIELGIVLPGSVTDIWDRCENRQRDPLLNDPPIPLTEADHQLIDLTLSDAFEQAEKWRDITTEPHWIAVVVGPILHLLRRVEAFNRATVSNAKTAVLNMTYTEIAPVELVPFSKDPLLYRDLDKRIDYVVGLDLNRDTLRTLHRSKYCTSIPSINQTTSFANKTAIFLNIKVKRSHVACDPTIQLATWVAAEFTKRRYEGWKIDFPVFAIEIDGDSWFLRVATARISTNKPRHVSNENPEGRLPEDEFELHFFGPLALGNTLTMENSKILLANLLDIARWGQCDYRTWWEANVFEVLEEQG